MRMSFMYILASKRNGTLYVGVTSDLERRIEEHKQKIIPGFTSEYGVDKLVYYESYEMIIEAIAREKEVKGWRRKWKLALIESINPHWEDLAAGQYIAYPKPDSL